MMKVITYIVSMFFLLFSVLIALYALFDIKPFITKNNGWGFGILEFEIGIPVPVNIIEPIPDTVIHARKADGSWSTLRMVYPGSRGNAPYNNGPMDSVPAIYRDTTFTKYSYYPFSLFDPAQIQVSGSRIMSGRVYIRTKQVWIKIMLLSPLILSSLLAAYSVWHIGILLDNILKGRAFQFNNYRRLQSVGNAILLCQLFLIFSEIISSGTVNIKFYDTITDHFSHIQFSARMVNVWSFNAVLIGCMLKIFGIAFKKGYELQQGQGFYR